MKKNPKNQIEQIALERIYRLFFLANEWFEKHPARSNRCVELALKIGSRNRVRVPIELKTSYCKKCKRFLKDKRNANVTQTKAWIEITCLECNARFKRRGTPNA